MLTKKILTFALILLSGSSLWAEELTQSQFAEKTKKLIESSENNCLHYLKEDQRAIFKEAKDKVLGVFLRLSSNAKSDEARFNIFESITVYLRTQENRLMCDTESLSSRGSKVFSELLSYCEDPVNFKDYVSGKFYIDLVDWASEMNSREGEGKLNFIKTMLEDYSDSRNEIIKAISNLEGGKDLLKKAGVVDRPLLKVTGLASKDSIEKSPINDRKSEHCLQRNTAERGGNHMLAGLSVNKQESREDQEAENLRKSIINLSQIGMVKENETFDSIDDLNQRVKNNELYKKWDELDTKVASIYNEGVEDTKESKLLLEEYENIEPVLGQVKGMIADLEKMKEEKEEKKGPKPNKYKKFI